MSEESASNSSADGIEETMPPAVPLPAVPLPAMPPPAAPSRRGLLGIEITLSNSSPTAGSEFTLYVRVTNPLDVPIWLSKLQVFVPSEVELVTRRMGSRRQQSQGSQVQPIQAMLTGAATGAIGPAEDFTGQSKSWWQKLFLNLGGMSGEEAPEYVL